MSVPDVQDSRPPVVFLPASEFTIERVFPIRNLVNKTVEGTWENGDDALRSGADAQPGTSRRDDVYVAAPAPPPRLPTPPSTPRSVATPPPPDNGPSITDDGNARLVTERNQIVPSQSGPPGVLPGVTGEETKSTFHRCEDEPIRIPGAIQPFGALVAIKSNADEVFECRICSENCRSILGYGPEELFGLRSFLDIIEPGDREEMVIRVTHALEHPAKPNEDTQLDIFNISIISSDGSRIRLWGAIHALALGGLVICEFEEYADGSFLKDPEGVTNLPKTPFASLGMDVSPEDRLKSTTSGSTPLKALRMARWKGQTASFSMDIFNAMTQAQQQLAASNTVQQVLDVVVGIISELTSFHRVMMYRFDEQMNGSTDAELVHPEASNDLFRGKQPRLHFPASDIPKQARDLYKINRIRVLHDRDAETARLVCRDATDFAVPLDLSHSYLRAMSPIHLKYLGNMGVRSSMSVSIVINSELWGLIACHQYGEHGLRVPLPTRELCRNIGECAATNIERLLMIQRIKARKPPATTPPTQSPAGFIAASSADLLRVFDAEFGLLSIQDEARAIGRLDPYPEALAILTHLQSRRFTTIISSQNINVDFPDIKYAAGIHMISGLLIIPLSIGGNDFLVFFRKGQLKEIRWAGNPYEKIVRAGSEYLEPRASFKRWTETVLGRSKQWTDDQLETARVLSLLYGRFIEIWRQKESASQNSRMTRLLISNASHEVRTPLNAIVNYLEMALEDKMEDPTRELLEKAHKASRSLIYVIDDLLNLTKAEDGPVNSKGEMFDLGATVSYAITAFRKEAMRRGLDLTVSTHQGLPKSVKGDAARLRQVLSNLTTNAFQHSVTGGIKVDIRPILTKETISVIDITVQDVGAGMSETQLDDLFQEFEQIIDEDGRSVTTSNLPPIMGDDMKTLGLGLAVVARYVRNMNGQIRVRSELGKGTIFGIELPFEHASPLDNILLSPGELPALEVLSVSTHTQAEPPLVSLPDLKSKHMTSRNDSTTLHQEVIIPLPKPPHPTAMTPGTLSSGFSSLSGASGSPNFPFPRMGRDDSDPKELLSVLIAEDNPINAKLLTRRLVRLGHEVVVACDGQECHDHFVSKLQKVDVILMDLQMPLIDGVQCTQMIRALEKESGQTLKERPRVPIIAVSATLTEDNRFDYLQNGFDGWILKPIDFKRLDFLLQGINTRHLRYNALYTPGAWEQGGWFLA
ncbi:Cyanobacterial phytochrome B [Lachnellula subtilissima]|uniref:Cyanobacterial phytochrome B n=1 Tax=Lachnellula subtilissima TaxID=602034 RepID=A0A8H8RQ19_9HELO|nr:Cyanobacterial phytochrome B [Lachnellula subtilissima]